MIRPPSPWAIICLAASWVPKNALFRLMSRTLWYCASVVSSTEVRVSMPALLTMMSSRPKVLTAAPIRASQVGDLADVGLDRGHLVAEVTDLLLERLGGFRIGHVVDDDGGALGGQGKHHRLADTGVPAGDDGHFSLECHSSSFPRRPTESGYGLLTRVFPHPDRVITERHPLRHNRPRDSGMETEALAPLRLRSRAASPELNWGATEPDCGARPNHLWCYRAKECTDHERLPSDRRLRLSVRL